TLVCRALIRHPRRRGSPGAFSSWIPACAGGMACDQLRIRHTGLGRSVVLPEVHAAIEARDLLGIAVERQRRALEELADAALARLAPARVIDVRVHVRIEAVLVRRGLLPRVHRLALDEADLHDRLGAL